MGLLHRTGTLTAARILELVWFFYTPSSCLAWGEATVWEAATVELQGKGLQAGTPPGFCLLSRRAGLQAQLYPYWSDSGISALLTFFPETLPIYFLRAGTYTFVPST